MKCSYFETDPKYFNSKPQVPKRSREFGYVSDDTVPKSYVFTCGKSVDFK